MQTYREFLKEKQIIVKPSGFDIADSDINPMLFEWQRDIVRWAIRRGKAALFEDCGLGKTPQQLEWARLVSQYTGKPVLILAPLAVTFQTKAEGVKFGVDVTVCETQSDVRPGVNVTNYEKLHHFDNKGWGGIVLDESSILKALDGKTKNTLIKFARVIPYRLCCTATPAPNDLTELTNHASFLSIMSRKEVIAMFFTQDGNSSHNYRLKGHARHEFWQWMSQWSVAIRQPSDLGYDDDGFVLPPLNIESIEIGGIVPTGYLVPVVARSLTEQREVRKATITERVQAVADMVNGNDEPWLVWCDYNYESEALRQAIPDAVEVKGSDSTDHKVDALIGFKEQRYRVLVTKPSIAGFGMNWQHCANVAFVGVGHSYEQWYQAVRRTYRFGQTKPVNVWMIHSSNDGAVVDNLWRKEKQATMMFDNIVQHMALESELNKRAKRYEMTVENDVAQGDDWTLYLGDSVATIANVESKSVGLVVFSPPFPGMYAYTNSVADMGNSKDTEELTDHFNFLIPELKRIMMPGRLCCIHLTQAPLFKGRDGYVGRKDFRGELIRRMEHQGFVLWSEVTIDKNPQVKASRTKEHTLLFKTLATDSTKNAPCMADYLVVFKSPGDNPVPVRAGNSDRYDNAQGWVTNEEWIEWAADVWYGAHRGIPGGISETDVLNVRQARETDDERHLAPLQLGVIRRCVLLWSNPGEIVYSPFAGIGSEGYVSIKEGRRFIGGELKRSYWESAIENLEAAAIEKNQPTLFDFAAMVKKASTSD